MLSGSAVFPGRGSTHGQISMSSSPLRFCEPLRSTMFKMDWNSGLTEICLPELLLRAREQTAPTADRFVRVSSRGRDTRHMEQCQSTPPRTQTADSDGHPPSVVREVRIQLRPPAVILLLPRSELGPVRLVSAHHGASMTCQDRV
jgi:hypothetical protein